MYTIIGIPQINPKYVSRRLTVEKAAHNALRRYAIDLGGGIEWFKAVTPNEKADFHRCFCNATKSTKCLKRGWINFVLYTIKIVTIMYIL
jgi:hypothetical protein